MGEVQKADPKARRAGLVIVGGGAILGLALMKVVDAFRPDLETWIQQDPDAPWAAVATLTIVTAGPVLGMAAYFWSLGRRIIRVERFPPPGMRVLRDTPVVIGHAALQRGRLMQAWAVFLGLAGVLLAFFLWRLCALLDGAGRH